MLAAYLLLALLLIAGPVHSQTTEGPRRVEGVWFDDLMWSAVWAPDSAVICRWQDGNLRCTPLPPGSIILYPQSEK